MQAHENPSSGSNDPTRHPVPPPGLELHSSSLTAGRDLYLNINSGYGKQSLPDTRQLARWLSSLNQHQVHKDVFDKVTPGTGEWMLDSLEFTNWVAKKTKILWGTGIPGAGKTCLSSIIIDNLIHREWKSVVFFYCQYKEQPSIHDVLACFLKQMIESSEAAAQFVAMTLYASCARTDTRPSRSELSKTLKETAQRFDSLFFVVDALDELSDDTRFELITELSALQCPLLMTSRPLPNLLDLTPVQFDIRPPEHDFDTFISATISCVPKLRPFLRDPGLRRDIIQTIQNKCDGMFLLAALQIEALASTGIINAHSLLQAVNRLPDTLNNQYKVTLQRIHSQSAEERDLALRVILWATHAIRYLQVDELLEALTVNTEVAAVNESQRTTEETLISVCLGLITVEKESRIVRLIHFTAQQFFETQHAILLKCPHKYIANVCAIYLNCIQVKFPRFTTLEEILEQKPENPLIEYSSFNICHHTYEAITKDHCQVPIHVVNLFFEREHASIPLDLFGDKIDFGHAIHFAAAYGIVSLFEQHEGRIDEESVLGYTPLFYACLGGHLVLVQRIITQWPASLMHSTSSGATLLHAAAQGGNDSVVKVLLSMCGPKVPLSGALHPTPTVLSVEEYTPIDINAQTLDGRTALCIASEDGNLPVVEALLSHAALNTNLGDRLGWTPLHISSACGHEKIVQLLLQCSSIDVNVTDSDGSTPLHHTARNGYESIARLLLDTPGINIYALTKRGITPLHIAVLGRKSSLLKLFLHHPGINVNAKDVSGYTPLHYAAELGDESAIQILLETSGIDINAGDNDGSTPLHSATVNGHNSIIRLLQGSPGIDVNAKERTIGWTPLHHAACNGDETVVQSLLTSPGIDINAQSTDEPTPLHCTPSNTVEIPFNCSIGADIRCDHGSTPLSLASEYGHTDIVRIFLNCAVVNLNNIDDDGDTPLMCAAYNGHTSVARLLLNRPGIRVNVQDKESHRTALSWACDASRTPAIGGTKTEGEAYPLIVLLLEHEDININLADKEGRTPLYYASRAGFWKVVELLEERGAIMQK